MTLLINAVLFVLLPGLALVFLARPTWRGWWTLRFLLALPLLPALGLGLAKLIWAPFTAAGLTAYDEAAIELSPFVALLLVTGLPGLLFRRRRRGVLIAMLVFGGFLTFLTTYGSITKNGLEFQSLVYFTSSAVVAVFLAAWARADRPTHSAPPSVARAKPPHLRDEPSLQRLK